MSQENINIIGAVITVIMFLISIVKDIYKRQGKWYRRITLIGWFSLFVSGLVIWLAVSNNRFAATQKAAADSTLKVNFDHLIARMDSQLKEHNLQYDSATGTFKPISLNVTNISGDVAKDISGPVGVIDIGGYNTRISDVKTGLTVIHQSKEQSEFCSSLKGASKNRKTITTVVYLYYARGTRGDIHFSRVTSALRSCGFSVIQRNDTIINPSLVGERGHITRHEDKITIVVGDTFVLN